MRAAADLVRQSYAAYRTVGEALRVDHDALRRSGVLVLHEADEQEPAWLGFRAVDVAIRHTRVLLVDHAELENAAVELLLARAPGAQVEAPAMQPRAEAVLVQIRHHVRIGGRRVLARTRCRI